MTVSQTRSYAWEKSTLKCDQAVNKENTNVKQFSKIDKNIGTEVSIHFLAKYKAGLTE